jgi:Ca2+-binding RTX toxin-like protein
MTTIVYGTEGDDIFAYPTETPFADVEVYGLGGKDSLLNVKIAHGGRGNDTILAQQGFGGDGHDILRPASNDASLEGNAGNDTLFTKGRSIAFGGDGNDKIYDIDTGVGENKGTAYGDAGNDTIVGKFAVAYGGTGDDIVKNLTTYDPRLDPSSGEYKAYGGDGNDVVNAVYAYGDNGNDTIEARYGYGGDGNDTISVKAFVFFEGYAYGGAGDDTITGSVDSILRGEDGNDTLYVDDLSYAEGGNGDDRIVVIGAKSNRADGDDGNDIIEGTYAGAHGGNGNDILNVTATFIFGDAGDDRINSINPDRVTTVQIEGGDGNDYIRHEFTNVGDEIGSDFIDGGEGIDTLELTEESTFNLFISKIETVSGHVSSWIKNFENVVGSAANDTIIGSEGTNILKGGAGTNLMDGGWGDDIIESTGTNDTAYGGRGNDTFIFSNGTFHGDSGDDTFIVSGDGVFTAHGGTGVDTLDASALTTALTIRLDQGKFIVGENTSTLWSIENAVGGAGDDKLFGSDANNTLIGGDGGDYLHGGNGDDVLKGGSGTDALYGGAGADVLDGGGDEIDIATYFNATSGIVLNLTTGIHSGDAAGDTFFNIDYFFGSSKADTLIGDSTDNFLVGSSGNDRLEGNAGTDTLKGDQGRDILLGGSGSDYLSGGRDSDILDGGNNQDALEGGEGNDRFVFTGNASQASSLDFPDAIADFETGKDKIDLSGLDANTLIGGDQAFWFIGGNDFSNFAGQLRQTSDGLQGDLNGDGVADFAIRVFGFFDKGDLLV